MRHGYSYDIRGVADLAAFRPTTDTVSRIADVAILTTFIYIAIPETMIPERYQYVGPAPLEYPLFYLAFVMLLLDCVLNGIRLSKMLFFAYVATLYMLFLGIANGGRLRDIVQDASFFFGIVAGMTWAARRSLHQASRILALIRNAYFFIIPGIILMIVTGLMSLAYDPSVMGGRMIVQSMFFPAYYFSVTLPFLNTMGSIFPDTRTFLGRNGAYWLGIICVFVVASITATRSIAAVGLVSVLVWTRTEIRRRQWSYVVQAVVISMVVFIIMSDNISFVAGNLISRVRETTLSEEETRIREAKALFSHIEGNELTGMGFGSRFHRGFNIADTDHDLTLAAHVAILNYLLKGGVLVFVGYVLIPFVFALRRFLFPLRGQVLLTSLWGGILVHLVMSSSSGGYSFPAMFLYGYLLALAFKEEHRLKMLRRSALRTANTRGFR